MARRKLKVEEQDAQQAAPPADGQQPQPTDRLGLARAKLTRMEETNKICFRHRGDLERIESELQKFNYTQEELDHILEPKGQKNIPGYSFTEMEAQRQFVSRMSSRESRGESHGASIQQETGPGEGPAMG